MTAEGAASNPESCNGPPVLGRMSELSSPAGPTGPWCFECQPVKWAASKADCNERRYPSDVNVAPDTVSI